MAGACLLLHNIGMILMDAAGVPLPLAMLVSFAVVAGTGYVLHSRISFHASLCWTGLRRYVSAMSANIGVSMLITWLLRDGLRLPMVAAAPLASIVMLAINFFLSRWAFGIAARSTE